MAIVMIVHIWVSYSQTPDSDLCIVYIVLLSAVLLYNKTLITSVFYRCIVSEDETESQQDNVKKTMECEINYIVYQC